METILFWSLAVLSAICVGLGKGGVPVISALAVPILALVISPVSAAGLLLPVFLVADIFGLLAYRKQFDEAVLKILGITMTAGVFIGYLTVDLVSEAAVTVILGLIGTAFALSIMMRTEHEAGARAPRWGGGLIWGTITGFTSFVSHSGSVPFQVYVLPLKLPKLVFAGTMTVAFAYINIIKLVPFYLLGQLNPENMKTAGILMIPAVMSVFIGLALVRVTPERLFFQVVTWALLLLSIRLLWDGLAHLVPAIA